MSASGWSARCEDCAQIPLDADSSGFYVTPFLRATFGTPGAYAAVLRSNLLMTSDLMHMTFLGFEYGLP